MLILHKASAGSGKTYTLAFTYIKLLLGEYDALRGRYCLIKKPVKRHRAILAITFTNKATEEMKTRIIERLTELANRAKCEYADGLCADLHCNLTDLQDAARTALKSLLADYTQFNVSTIDAFFQEVMRTFARELDISTNYEVDLDSDHAISVGVREMLSSIKHSQRQTRPDQRIKLLTRWISTYMEEQMTQGNSTNLFRRTGADSIAKFVKSSLNETYRLNVEQIKEYTDDISRINRFDNALNKKCDQIAKRLKQLIDKLNQTIELYGFRPDCFSINMYKNVMRWSKCDYEVKATAKAYDEDIKKRYVAKRIKATDVPFEVDHALCEVLKYGVEQLPLYAFYRHIHKNLFHFGILADAEHKMTEYLRENQVVLLDNTQTLLRRIINIDDTPFIYERMGLRLKHFLIDEFQDTSRLQWLNMSPLVEESIANGHENLIIGDEKQSIYRFRNADPELITTVVPQQFAGKTKNKGNNPGENTNYRSAYEIVAFNNALFATMADKKRLLSVYGNVVQNINKVNLSGYVDISPYESVNESIENMVSHIKRQLASGYSQRDIAILVSSNREGQLVVNNLLDRAATDPTLRHLQIVTQEALSISSSRVVRRAVSIMRYIDATQSVNNGQPTTQQRLAALNNRFEELLRQGLTHEQALSAVFENDDLTAGHDARSLSVASGEYTTLPSIVENIMSLFTTETERIDDNIYISAFHDLVANFSQRGNAGLHQFIRWWDETGCKRSLEVPQTLDAINVMTIHKSKGLEFKCVHVPFVSWPTSSSGVKFSWFRIKADNGINATIAPEFSDTDIFNPDDVPPMMPLSLSSTIDYMSLTPQYVKLNLQDDIDNTNKTYVAFTRAARELIIGVPTKKGAPDSGAARDIVESLSCSQLDYDQLHSVITNFNTQNVPFLTPNFDRSAMKFIFGKPTQAEVKTDEQTVTHTMPPYVAYENKDVWQINRLEDYDDMLQARHEGIVLHDIMSHIRTVKDVPKAVLRSVTRGYLTPDRRDEITQLITAAVSRPEAIRWFNNFRHVITERSLANVEHSDTFIAAQSKTDKLLTPHSRPDRIVWMDDGSIEIIDYKFGDERSSYTRQMLDYIAYISQCFPDAPSVRGYLWHPLTGQMRLIEPRLKV